MTLPAVRLFDQVGEAPTGCWYWLGYVGSNGYGYIKVSGRLLLTHRYAYELFRGPVPTGLELDHLCRNTTCCNPSHLEPVTHAENVRRGVSGEANRRRQLARTHCARGHEWTSENTKQTPRQRKCRTCIRQDSERARQRRKDAA